MSDYSPTQDSLAILRAIHSSLIDTIPADWLRFYLGNEPVGWIAPARITATLTVLPDCSVTDAGLLWHPAEPSLVSANIQTAAERLRTQGLISGWRNEAYALVDDAGNEVLRLERAAFRFFGLRSRAVHINGYVARAHHDPDIGANIDTNINTDDLWIGRRAAHKATDPNRLDNLAAGGIAAGESVWDCAVRELAEEAGVPSALAVQMQARTTLHSVRVEPEGLHDEILYVFDLALPQDFIPHNQDGEVAESKRMQAADVVQKLGAGEFTRDAGAVTAGLMLRHA